jgi:NTP pyrophosphatase (non-canonical NTP hydrolase)
MKNTRKNLTKKMENYIELALRTELKDYESVSKRFTPEIARLMHSGMGLSTEANEFLDALKKHTMYNKPLDKVNLVEEISDLLWYCAIACDELGVSFEEIMKINIDKLKARYGEKYSDDKAINRDLTTEREILEKVELNPIVYDIDFKSFENAIKKYEDKYLLKLQQELSPEKKLIVNAIKCEKCGDVIRSRHRHDYRDCSCGSCAVDGGTDYRRLRGDYTDLAVYSTDNHELIREWFEWGSYGKDRTQDLHYIKLRLLNTDHIEAILRTQTLLPEVDKILKYELYYRNNK